MTISPADVQAPVRSVTFASCYVYSPAGLCPASRRSRLLRALLKDGDADYLARYAVRVRREADERRTFDGFFDAATVLIPVPGSAPTVRGARGASDRLATALLRAGLGGLAWAGLRRISAVRKSATAPAGGRPTVSTHYDSFAVDGSLSAPEQILLIDDIVSKGRTLLAASMRVREAFPGARIRAFALLRTMGFAADVERLLDPCVGEIRWARGDAQRNP